jgi:hypothetical protein
MTRQRILAFLLILVLGAFLLPTSSVFAQGTDEIQNYTIDIVPQDDGTLINTYAITWCVISDAAGPLTWFTIGMPNENFEIISFSGDAALVKPEVSGFDYLMRIDLSQEANAGDCVNASVQVHQYGLAYLDEETKEVFYQIIPGWFDEVPVQHLKVTLALPADPTQIKSFDPQPKSKTETLAVWETALDEGDKFTLNLFYELAAFPNFDPDKPAANPATNTSAGNTNSNQNQTGSYPSANAESPSEDIAPATGFFETISTTFCTCIIIIFVILFLIILFSLLANSSRSYRGGSTFGGYHGGGGSSSGGSIFGSGGGSAGRSDRSGGGSGLFGGRGSSCACVSSGCACACAGGGRAGCSRKGFDVSGLFKAKKQEGE